MAVSSVSSAPPPPPPAPAEAKSPAAQAPATKDPVAVTSSGSKFVDAMEADQQCGGSSGGGRGGLGGDCNYFEDPAANPPVAIDPLDF